MNTQPTAPTHEEVTARAQQLWQLAGNPVGHDVELWLAAEAEVKQERVEITQAADSAAAVPPPAVTARAKTPAPGPSSAKQKRQR